MPKRNTRADVEQFVDLEAVDGDDAEDDMTDSESSGSLFYYCFASTRRN